MGTIHYLNNHLDKFRETKITITFDDLEGFANYDNLNKPDKKIVKLFIECFKNKEDYFSFQNKIPQDLEKIGLYRLVANYWVAYICYYYNNEFEEILSKCLLKIKENVILLESPHFCKKVFYYLNELKKVV